MQEQKTNSSHIDLDVVEKLVLEYDKKLSLNNNGQSYYVVTNKSQQSDSSSSSCTILDDKFAEQIKQFTKINFTLDFWPAIINSINSDDILQKHYGIIGIRKLLSVEDSPPIQLVIDHGLVPTLVHLGHQIQFPQIQFECLWALTNITSGTTQQTRKVVELGGFSLFLECLNSPIMAIAEQATWAVGNLAGDSCQFRDLLIMNGAIQRLNHLISENFHVNSMIKNGFWALCNLCRGKPLPQYHLIKQGIHLCCKFLVERQIIDPELLREILWAICYSQGLQNDLKLQQAQKLILKVSSYLTYPDKSIVDRCLRILANLFENESFTSCFVKNKCIDLLYNLLNDHKKTLRRQTCFVIARITDVHNYNIGDIFQNPNLVPKLLQLFETDAQEVRIQIAYVFANLSCHDNFQNVLEFYKHYDILKFYTSMLHGNAKMIKTSLQCLNKVISVGQKCKENDMNILAQKLVENQTVKIIESLQCHQSNQIYSKAFNFIEKYFSKYEYQDDEVMIDEYPYQNASAAAPPM